MKKIKSPGRPWMELIPKFLEHATYWASGCWIWRGARSSENRYGSVSNNRENVRAHRLSWTIYNGDIPGGMCVLHRCDNGLCVNPRHLFLGTQLDNARDRSAKGRNNHPMGEAHPMAKISEAQVRAIRSEPPSVSNQTMAAKYGLRYETIWKIRSGRTWQHVS